MTDNSAPKSAIPRYALWRHAYGNERVRVLEYVGNNTFRVLASNDATYRVPKHQLTFLAASSKTKQSV